jgi:CLIP-associating protein 1/2
VSTFGERETEETWKCRDVGVRRLRSFVQGDLRDIEGSLAMWQQLLPALFQCLHSLRTQLCCQTCWLFRDVALSYGTCMKPLANSVLLNLMKVCHSTKKMIVHACASTVDDLITSSQSAQLIDCFDDALQDKNRDYRVLCMKFIVTLVKVIGACCLDDDDDDDVTAPFLRVLQLRMSQGIVDANAHVRQQTREAFHCYEQRWREEAACFLAAETAVMKQAFTGVVPLESNKPVLEWQTIRDALRKKKEKDLDALGVDCDS